MTTPLALLLDRCGLSHREAAVFLTVRPDTVKAWARGRNPTPPGAIAELRALYGQIEEAAARLLDLIEARGVTAGVVELGLARDDAEAQALGWPCVGAHAAMLGIVVASLHAPVRIVPRGSTPASIAAARAHVEA